MSYPHNAGQHDPYPPNLPTPPPPWFGPFPLCPHPSAQPQPTPAAPGPRPTCGEARGDVAEGGRLHPEILLRRGGGGRGGRGGGGGRRGGGSRRRCRQRRAPPPLRRRGAQQRVEIQSPFQSGSARHGGGQPRPGSGGAGKDGGKRASDVPGGCGARESGAAAGQVGEARGSRRRLGTAPEKPGRPRRALGLSAPRFLRGDRLPSEVDPARGATQTRSPTRRCGQKLACGGDARKPGGGCGRRALGNALDPLPLHRATLPPAAGPNMASITTPPIQILRLQGACARGAGPTRLHSGICGVSLRAGVRLKGGYPAVIGTTTPVIHGARSRVPG